jgi:hypothetical protein
MCGRGLAAVGMIANAMASRFHHKREIAAA